jgi:hypothetical protein
MTMSLGGGWPAIMREGRCPFELRSLLDAILHSRAGIRGAAFGLQRKAFRELVAQRHHISGVEQAYAVAQRQARGRVLTHCERRAAVEGFAFLDADSSTPRRLPMFLATRPPAVVPAYRRAAASAD